MTIEIADRLVVLRKNKGLSQEELAEKLGVSRQAVSKWERAEASPDLEKLIALSKLYDITLDELLLEKTEILNEPTAQPHDTEEKNSETGEEPAVCDSPPGADACREDAGPKETETEEPPKQSPSVHINWKDGVHVKGVNGDEVHVSWNGLHVEGCGGDCVHLGSQGIHVEEQKGDRVDISRSGVFVNGQPVKNNPWFRFPYPLIALGLFLGWGFSGLLGGWAVSWLSFLTVPIYYAVAAGVGKGQCFRNSFALIVALFFFVWGFSGWLGGWLYSWMIFLAIPLYYSVVEAVRHRQASKFCYPVLALLAFFMWGFWGGLGGFALSWLCFLTIPLYYWVCRLCQQTKED